MYDYDVIQFVLERKTKHPDHSIKAYIGECLMIDWV
jgi:hypothetical protein